MLIFTFWVQGSLEKEENGQRQSCCGEKAENTGVVGKEKESGAPCTAPHQVKRGCALFTFHHQDLSTIYTCFWNCDATTA